MNIPFNEVYEKVKHIRAGCHTSELEKIYNLACEVPQDGLIVEIGSYFGSSACMMAQTGKQIICIDCFKAGFDGFGDDKVYMEDEFKKNISPYSNIKLYNNLSNTAKKWVRKPIDLLFIDGDHSYEGVKADIQNYLFKVKEGGKIVFHDYASSHHGVKKAADELMGDCKVIEDIWSMRII